LNSYGEHVALFVSKSSAASGCNFIYVMLEYEPYLLAISLNCRSYKTDSVTSSIIMGVF